MFRVKATVRFLRAWRHPDEIARDVETELRFHIEMRTRANIEKGMKPDEAQLAARKSFGDFERVKATCCEISRSLPFDPTPLRMGIYIAVAVLAGGTAVWAVKMPHHNFPAVLWQLVSIAVLAWAFIAGRRSVSSARSADDRFRRSKVLSSEVSEEPNLCVASHDEEGRTPVERIFKSE